MIKIVIQNKIKIAEQEELIHEEYDGEFKKISGKWCLIYQNSATERVLIKFDENELSMIRYADSPVKLHFHKDFLTNTYYEGLGFLNVTTKKLQVNLENASVNLNYHLSQNEQKIADYQMQISWR